jgi:hypothetical protein
MFAQTAAAGSFVFCQQSQIGVPQRIIPAITARVPFAAIKHP